MGLKIKIKLQNKIYYSLIVPYPFSSFSPCNATFNFCIHTPPQWPNSLVQLTMEKQGF